MSCPTCGHDRMEDVADAVVWCEECGTLVDQGHPSPPTLVESVKAADDCIQITDREAEGGVLWLAVRRCIGREK